MKLKIKLAIECIAHFREEKMREKQETKEEKNRMEEEKREEKQEKRQEQNRIEEEKKEEKQEKKQEIIEEKSRIERFGTVLHLFINIHKHL